jgi:hypothetical protein
MTRMMRPISEKSRDAVGIETEYLARAENQQARGVVRIHRRRKARIYKTADGVVRLGRVDRCTLRDARSTRSAVASATSSKLL